MDLRKFDALFDKVVLALETAHICKADNSTGQTTHVTTAKVKLLTFSNNCSCTNLIRVPETLLYPVILRNRLMGKQNMMIGLKGCALNWGG